MSSETKYFIGTSGWSYDHWVGKFYPEDIEKRDWIKFYAEYYNTVELNMSFYRFPFPNMLKGWKNKLPETFRMTLKANRQITHVKKFKDVDDLVKRFYGLTDLLNKKAGCILFQAPPSMKMNDSSLTILESFLENLDKSRKNVLEFRHKSWWNDDVYQLLNQHNVAFCTVSGLNMPTDMVVTADFAYFRFHGPGKAYASKYSDDELKQWSDRLKEAAHKYDLKDVYCYFNNDIGGYAVEDAAKLRELLH